MWRLPSPQDCDLRFGILRSWFGGPALVDCIAPDGEIEPLASLLDGRARAQRWGVAPSGIPVRLVETPRDAVRCLCAVGEYERALGFVPANIDRSNIAAWSSIPPTWAALMVQPRKQKRPGETEKARAIARCQNLLEAAEGGSTVEASDLRWALGQFANFRRVKR
jgi:hypothetical protein